mgnify:CR=1 FL=1
MANGQQEQQSIVTGQQQALAQTQNPEQSILQEIQKPKEQEVQQPQFDNVYQAIGSSSPQQLLELKNFVAKRGGQRELYRNVGSDRGFELMDLVNKGEMSIAQAIDRSKQELTPNMKMIDNVYFSKDASIEKMLVLKERMKKRWTMKERNLWLSHLNSLKAKKRNQEIIKARGDKKSQKQLMHNAKNEDYKDLAQVDYNNIQGVLDLPRMFLSQKVDEEYNTAVTNLISSMYKDHTEGGSVSQEDLNTQAAIAANKVPIEFLRGRKGLLIGDDFIELPADVEDEGTLRVVFAQALMGQIVKAKNHLANISEYQEPIEEVDEQVDEFSQFLVE